MNTKSYPLHNFFTQFLGWVGLMIQNEINFEKDSFFEPTSVLFVGSGCGQEKCLLLFYKHVIYIN